MRHLRTRLSEHRLNIRKMACDHSVVVSKHRNFNNHEFEWSEPVILHQEKHRMKREIAEMFHIKRCNKTINLQTDTDNLPNIYDGIIRITETD
ncbi:hypothetical protein X777_06136 [Ooceraea biroi]|uniref:Uncharacterized protein n=1 Tax=Ooceraea biroi TaxID=2015173 RepID=A0A026WF45_OOCBI|nr:hypothetical protein X777_06136 [Ooceraea biroi]